MKDGTTHLAYKPEHAVDLDTGAIIAAPIHAADKGYHSRAVMKDLAGGNFKTRIAEPEHKGNLH